MDCQVVSGKARGMPRRRREPRIAKGEHPSHFEAP